MLIKVPSGLNNLKSKVDNLDVDKLKLVPVYLKRIKRSSRKRSC